MSSTSTTNLIHLTSILAVISDAQSRTSMAVASALKLRHSEPILSTYMHGPRQKKYLQRGIPRPRLGGERITLVWLKSLSDAECRYRFRFYAREIVRLVDALHLPRVIRTSGSRSKFSALEALCLLLAYLSSGANQHHLSMVYNRQQSCISECVNEVVEFLNTHWDHLLGFDTHFLTQGRLELYANCIHAAGSPVPTVWGFLDCTIRHMCRPSEYQRVAYNGHKKMHALKYQAVRTPDGMFAHLFGPVEGRRNDNHLLAASHLLRSCARHAIRPGADQDTPVHRRCFQMYGDPAYGISPCLLSPFSYGDRSRLELAFNSTMSPLRMTVEHGFGDVVRLWPFMNMWWKHKVFLSPIGAFYRVAVLLTNARNCLRPNSTSMFFGCPPPALEEYFVH